MISEKDREWRIAKKNEPKPHFVIVYLNDKQKWHEDAFVLWCYTAEEMHEKALKRGYLPENELKEEDEE